MFKTSYLSSSSVNLSSKKINLIQEIQNEDSEIEVEDVITHEDLNLAIQEHSDALFKRILSNDCEWFKKIVDYGLFGLKPPPKFQNIKISTSKISAVNHNSAIFLENCTKSLLFYLEDYVDDDLLSPAYFRALIFQTIKRFISTKNKTFFDRTYAAYFNRFITCVCTEKSLKLPNSIINLLIPILIDNCQILAYQKIIKKFLSTNKFVFYSDIKYPILSKILFNAFQAVRFIQNDRENDSNINDHHNSTAIYIQKMFNKKEKMDILKSQPVSKNMNRILPISLVFPDGVQNDDYSKCVDGNSINIEWKSQFIKSESMTFNSVEDAEMYAYLLLMTIRTSILKDHRFIDYFRNDEKTNYSLIEALMYCGTCCDAVSLISLEAFKILTIVFNGDLSLEIEPWKFLEIEKQDIRFYDLYADSIQFNPENMTYKMIHAFPVFWDHRYNQNKYKMTKDEAQKRNFKDYYESLDEKPSDPVKFNRERPEGENAYEILQPCLICDPPISSMLLYNAFCVYLQILKQRKDLRNDPIQTEHVRDKMVLIDGLYLDFFLHRFNFGEKKSVNIVDLFDFFFPLPPVSDYYYKIENNSVRPILNSFYMDFMDADRAKCFFDIDDHVPFAYITRNCPIFAVINRHVKFFYSFLFECDFHSFDIKPVQHKLALDMIMVDELCSKKSRRRKKKVIKKDDEIKAKEKPHQKEIKSADENKKPNQKDVINKNEDFFFGEDEEQFHEILEKVYDGYFTSVYKIRDTRTEKIMCKKILKINSSKTTIKDLKKALKEFDVLHLLKHPCICHAIAINTAESVEDDSDNEITTVALFLEFIDYKLSDVLTYNVKNTLKARIVVEIAHGMSYLHKNKIIHRNLKIDNIMLNCVLESKIIDFGMVQINECFDELYFSNSISMNKDSQNMIFMSPEIVNDEESSYPTDVYSFGIILYYIFVGSLPKQSLKEKINGNTFKLPKPSSSISQFCIDLISKCVAAKPEERPTFDDIIKELRDNNFKLASEIDQSIVSRRDTELVALKLG